MRFAWPDFDGPVLAVGAHADDIEIGAGAALGSLADRGVAISFAIFTGSNDRRDEALSSLRALAGPSAELEWLGAQDGRLPYRDPDRAKDFLSDVAASVRPAAVFAPHRGDLHQDHRFAAELCWQTFRNTLILEYEIPKWEGDSFDPNLYVSLDRQQRDRKLDHLEQHFPSQHEKHWYDRELFAAVMRRRGIEAGLADRDAEAFVARRVVL